MLKGSRKYWLIAVICGLVASALVYHFLESVKASYRPGNLVPVVVARNDIARDTIITREVLRLDECPGQYVHPNAIRDIKQVIGKVAVQPVMAGEQILQTRLLDSAKANHLAYSIPVSKRAVSIAVDHVSGVGGQIKAGDRVDIIAVLDISAPLPQGGEINQSFSIVTLQDIEVLAVSDNNDGNGKGNQTLTLAVSVEEAPPLVLAAERGKLRMLLRSPVDQSRTDLPPYELKDFLQ